MKSLQGVSQWNSHLSIFGLSSLALDKRHFVFSKNRFLYSLSVCTFFLLLFCLQIIYTKFENLDVAFVFMKGYLVFGSNIVSFLLVVSALFNSQEKAHLLHQVTHHCKVDVRSINFYSRMIAITASLFILSLALDFMQLFFNLENWLMVVFNTLSIHFSLLYIVVHIFHFAEFLTWLKNSFNAVNENIMELNNGPEERKVQKVPHDSTEVGHKIREWRTKFHDLVVITGILNSLFAFQNLLIVGHNFLLGTLFAYGALSEAITIVSTPLTLEDVVELIVQSKWAALSFICIYALILPSRLIFKQGNEILDAIFHTLAFPVPKNEKDELHNFAIQFMNNDMVISPNGFFQFNNKLLISIVGSLLSYLVVLIQFRVSSFI